MREKIKRLLEEQMLLLSEQSEPLENGDIDITGAMIHLTLQTLKLLKRAHRRQIAALSTREKVSFILPLMALAVSIIVTIIAICI